MTRLAILSLLAAITITLSATTAAHAAPSVAQPMVMKEITWPDAPCNLDHRMDIAIVDGLFFECICERLLIGTTCNWYLVAGVPDEEAEADEAAKRQPIAPTFWFKRKIRKPRAYLKRGAWVIPVMRVRVPA